MMKLALAILVAPILVAQSQPPTPTPLKSGQEKQQLEGDKNGANKAPASVPKSATDRWIVIMPVVFSGMLVIIYGLQTGYMRRALEETTKAANAARDSANAAMEHLTTTRAAIDSAATSAAASAKIATDALDTMRQQSAAQDRFAAAAERFADASERFADATERLSGRDFSGHS
jgi:hypothetical protein